MDCVSANVRAFHSLGEKPRQGQAQQLVRLAKGLPTSYSQATCISACARPPASRCWALCLAIHSGSLFQLTLVTELVSCISWAFFISLAGPPLFLEDPSKTHDHETRAIVMRIPRQSRCADCSAQDTKQGTRRSPLRCDILLSSCS